MFICFDFENVLLNIYFFFHIPHSGHRSFKVLFRPNSNNTWLSYFPPLILFIISKQNLDCEKSLIILVRHSGPIAQSTREGRAPKRRGTRVIWLFCSPWRVRASEERKTTARGLQKSAFQGSTSWIAFSFCANLSNYQSECEVCCNDVNVIPNLSIVPKKLVMVTLKLSELHSENRPILPSKQRFLSCMAFSVGSRSRRIWRQRERLKNNRLKGDVTRDYSQRRFLAQHSVAMLEQCCNYSKQCRNNVATLCCAKNRRCESSRVTSP